MANLSLEARPKVTTRQSTTLTAVETKRKTIAQICQTTLSQCQLYHVQRKEKANNKENDITGGRCVHVTTTTCKGVPHKKLEVPSETVVTPAQCVAQCSKAYGGALERWKDMESADETSTTDNGTNIQTVGTNTGWSDSNEDGQGITRSADAAHAAEGDVWDKQAMLSSKASLVPNLAIPAILMSVSVIVQGMSHCLNIPEMVLLGLISKQL